MSDYEVVIAGGGHNALACAAVLCQAGIRTLVAERNEWVGGGAVTRELTLPGRVAGKLLDALQRPDYYAGVVDEVRSHLRTHHSYDRRVEELFAALEH